MPSPELKKTSNKKKNKKLTQNSSKKTNVEDKEDKSDIIKRTNDEDIELISLSSK